MSSEEIVVTMEARCTVGPTEKRPIRDGNRFNLYVHEEYFPCIVQRAEGGEVLPSSTGTVWLRAVMRQADRNLPSGTVIELREALHVFAQGELLSIAADD